MPIYSLLTRCSGFLLIMWRISFRLCLVLCCVISFEVSALAGDVKIERMLGLSGYNLSDGRLLLVSTNRTAQKINVPLIIGKNLEDIQSSKVIDALPNLPSWAKPGSTWAPDISRINNQYILYFTAREGVHNMQCVGVAHSEKPEGPYISNTGTPLICPPDVKGVIDPAVFSSGDGSNYLLYKVNIRHGGPNKAIWIRRLSSDGQQLIGEATPLLRADSPWEKGNVEAPTLILNAGTYYLFYSGAAFNKPGYAVGYAKSKNLLGPYIKSSDNPVIKTEGGLYSPGHQGVIRDKCGNLLFFFHAFDNKKLASPRNSYVKKLVFENDKPKFLDVDPKLTCH